MSGLGCCLWWFVFGVLLGWLLNWLFSKLFGQNPPASSSGSSGSAAARLAASVPPSAAVRSTTTASPSASVPSSVGLVDLNAAKAAGFNLRHADDLAVIDGIGPKIEELYREHGVTTFAQVAKMSVPQLQAILDAGGPHFKLANPATWAQQAQLIVDNKWGDLKKLHDELAAIEKAGNPNNHH